MVVDADVVVDVDGSMRVTRFFICDRGYDNDYDHDHDPDHVQDF